MHTITGVCCGVAVEPRKEARSHLSLGDTHCGCCCLGMWYEVGADLRSRMDKEKPSRSGARTQRRKGGTKVWCGGREREAKMENVGKQHTIAKGEQSGLGVMVSGR